VTAPEPPVRDRQADRARFRKTLARVMIAQVIALLLLGVLQLRYAA
jgi:hypothetical protein